MQRLALLFLLSVSFAQRADYTCSAGTYWSGQACLACLNSYCTCSSLGGCDKITCPTGTTQSSDGKSCIRCPTGCTSCSMTGNNGFTCGSCQSTYSLLAGTCVQTNAAANTLNGAARWQVYPTVTLNSSTRLSQSTCLGLSSQNGQCSTCLTNQFINEFGNCEFCVTGCSKCSSRGTCVECNAGMFWQVTTNNVVTTNGWGAGSCQACVGTGVLTCTTAQTPASCKTGYYLTGNSGASHQCLPCGNLCVACTDANTCTQCYTGTYLKNGLCLECFGNTATTTTCQSCNSGQSNSCDTCLSNYIKVGNTCQNCAATFPGCSSCSVSSNQLSCDVCYNGYYRVASQSSGGAPYTCASCTNYNSTYFRCSKDDSKNQASVVVTQCTSRAVGFTQQLFLVPLRNDSSISVCVPNINNCLKMKDDSANCTSCYTGMRLVNDVCQACPSNCNDDSCQVLKNVLTCTQCVDGYYLVAPASTSSAATCVVCPTGCSKCTSAVQCSTCSLGYRLYQNLCEKCQVDGCMTCNENKASCEFCRPQTFYYANQDKSVQCLLCPPGCKDCQSSNGMKCTTCLSGYYQYNDGCYLGSQYCAVYKSDGSCSKCQYGFYLTKGKCAPGIDLEGAYVMTQDAACSATLFRFGFALILMMFLSWL